MKQNVVLRVNGNKKLHSMENLYGVFFEDINHAADGGLYAEMIRNRSFEFDEIDNKSYNHLTAWEIINYNNVGEINIETENPLSKANPHYAVINPMGGILGLRNKGFNNGIYFEKDKAYSLDFYARNIEGYSNIRVIIGYAQDIISSMEFHITKTWDKYGFEFVSPIETRDAYVEIQYEKEGKSAVDFISLFPKETFNNRENGLRKDLAEEIKALKPAFMRFPGGCLIHDGSLDAEARDSLYRWKKTIGPLKDRPARKNNWGYNQTLGLGYYEYFLFCEDIGAKPIPVLPAAYNPHRLEAVPIDELEEWINDALDLIEFANGDKDTTWGKIRAELGHEEPFNMEYIAIGNEELFYPFIERYPYFHNAIKEKYSNIKVISSSGPFADGYDFEYMWDEAEKAGADIVDEHYYMQPEWMLKHVYRYDNYSRNRPKVFLGEYASLDNKYKNALYEGAFMTGIENNADIIELACYAPLLCNKDYVNWKPDMLWFDNKDIVRTPNYHVQRMFMENKGDHLLDLRASGISMRRLPIKNIAGRFGFESVNKRVEFSSIRINDEVICENLILEFDNEKLSVNSDLFEIVILEDGKKMAALYKMELPENARIEYDFVKKSGAAQLKVIFGYTGEEYYCFEMGGWANDMSNLSKMVNNKYGGLNIGSAFGIKEDEEYRASIYIKDRHIKALVNNKVYQDFNEKETYIETVYVTSSIDEKSGDIIVKCVNVEDENAITEVIIDSEIEYTKAEFETLKHNDLTAENTFENPNTIKPIKREKYISGNRFMMDVEPFSVNIIRLSR